jgi:hypothetical protein
VSIEDRVELIGIEVEVVMDVRIHSELLLLDGKGEVREAGQRSSCPVMSSAASYRREPPSGPADGRAPVVQLGEKDQLQVGARRIGSSRTVRRIPGKDDHDRAEQSDSQVGGSR